MTQTLALTGVVAADLRFSGTPMSIGQARTLAALILPDCPRLADVLVVVSELATNAVLHSASGATGGTYRLRVDVGPGAVEVAVDDQGPALVPARRPDGEGGHGLHLVAELADAYEVTLTETGRTAWCRLDMPAWASSSEGEASR
ncbi:ATP-binding protein [Sphaerisporangium fuscum]|uniref:ATP-binding protein n=1 Tax=Sphaerisporangium fuscum TaxID=2835868 RepID=UPI002029A253|nr:ATP-binding protein [Sphaerisporangium fuscum]